MRLNLLFFFYFTFMVVFTSFLFFPSLSMAFVLSFLFLPCLFRLNASLILRQNLILFFFGLFVMLRRSFVPFFLLFRLLFFLLFKGRSDFLLLSLFPFLFLVGRLLLSLKGLMSRNNDLLIIAFCSLRRLSSDVGVALNWAVRKLVF